VLNIPLPKVLALNIPVPNIPVPNIPVPNIPVPNIPVPNIPDAPQAAAVPAGDR
jgi:hypothetical protein